MSAAAKKTRRVAPRTRRAVIGSKGGQAKQKKPSIAQNSVPSISTARIVYLWSWGPIVGLVDGLRSLKLDGTPVQAPDGTINYPGVKWQFRNGELNQERLEGNTESSNEIDVKQELIFGTPWLHTITNSVSDAIRLRLSWPTLRSQDAAGNINGVRIDYAVDISTDNGPYVEALVSFVDRKNVTEYERAHRLELPAGSRWTIRVRRLTPNANSDLVADQMVVKAIAEVVDSDQEYPLTAVSSIEYDAQTFGGDIAKIAALMRGRIIRVPSNYDAETRTYATSGTGTSNGIWDGTFKEAYTNNPAWIFYDLVLHPYYGLGDRIDATMVDRWSLYRIAQYCDQMVPDGKGGMEPRFTCNLYFQKQAEAYAVLQDLASIFHGLAFWDGSQIVVNADMPGDPVYTYNQTQILNNGAIKYEGTRARDRHTLYMVSWDNPDQGFETDKEPVFDDEAMVELGGMVRETTVGAIGCTSLGQAQRAGQWAALTEKLQTQGGVFRVGLDGDIPKPGQVIAVADPMLVGRNNGGRISSAAGRVVTLDRDTTVPVGARLLVNLPSGKSEGRIVKSVAGRDVTVMADFSEQPQAESGWILDYEDLKLMQFYVRNVTRPEWHQFQFEVIQHDPSKFPAVDNGAVVDTRPITGIPVGTQDAPARVMLSQHVVIEQGIAVTVMSIAWDAAPNAVGYDVEWKWGAREWVPVPRTGELMADVRGIYSGQYMARVRAVSALNVSSIPVTSALTNLEGKVGLPPAVAFLTASSELFGIGIKWGFPAGAEDTQRTELWYGPANDLAVATKLADLAYPQADYRMQQLLAGATLFFWARLVDRTGNVGPFYPVGNGVMGQASAQARPILDLIAGQIGETELGKDLLDRIDLIDGPAGLVGSVSSRLKELDDQLQAQIDAIADISDSAAYDPEKSYTAGQSVLFTDGILYQAKGDVPAGAAPPDATYWLNVGQAVTTANGLAARVSTSETKITNIEGVNTAQSTQITGLQTSLTTTNGNVTAAQNAANAANTLAGGKGKVLVQTATPAAADQLVQNLWIDITGGANTPKRWSGTAWVAVTDKVATDAAAAAANALALATTKADASAVQSLTTRVTSAEGTISSQGTAITGLNNSLTTTNTNVTAAQNAANAANTLAGGKGKVIVQAAAPAVADRLAQNLWIDITGGANTPKRWTGSVWKPVTDKVATDAAAAAASALTVANTKADASAVTSLSNTVTQQGNTLTSQGTAVTSLTNRVTAAEGVNTAQSQAITQTDSKVSEVDGKVMAQASAFNALRSSWRGDDDGNGSKVDALKGWASTAAIANEEKTRASENEAIAQRTSTLDAKVGDNAANLTTLEKVVATNKMATAQSITQLSTKVGDNAANLTTLEKVVATNKMATAQSITQLSTKVGDQGTEIGQQKTMIETNTSIINDVSGKMSASWSVKMQYSTSTGQYIAAGIGLGIENTPAGLQSQFLVSADRFAIVNTIAGGAVSVPFAVQNGQVFMSSAFIQDGTITNAKIGNYIQSNNYVSGVSGWRLSFDGTFEMNGNIAGLGTMRLTNTFLKFIYSNGVVGIDLSL
ncbi:phage tail protein [Pseudomonas gessardii]|uniref:Phage tail protein n=1 Tax=Pseudomonas gessardii TaxID=78544 RepID=A0A7Y1MUU6_9PSED|nr:phage tail protein [Pseudomonas gessardii]NNA98787.1 phage tail protein [Pseudomonas gessardii]